MKSPLILTRCFAAMVFMVSGTAIASAPESGWYYGLNFGISGYSSSLTKAMDQVDADVTGTGTVDDSDATWSFAIGYRINKYFGLELAYVDLGKQSFTATGDVADLPWEFLDPAIDPADLVGLGISAKLDGDIHSSGALLDAVGSYPIRNFEFSARAGFLFSKTKFSSNVFLQDDFDPTNTGEVSFDRTSSTTELMAGLGVGYTFFEHLQIRTDFAFYKKVGEEDKTLETDISTVTAGIAYRF